jgi:hypothetical protein
MRSFSYSASVYTRNLKVLNEAASKPTSGEKITYSARAILILEWQFLVAYS